MRALKSLITLFLCAVSLIAQQHRVGTSGPEPPTLQGQGRWHYRAPLPHARSEVAVAEVAGKVLCNWRICGWVCRSAVQ